MMPPAPPAPFMPPTMMPPKKSKMPLLIVIFAVLGLVLVGISLAMPWYSYKIEYSGGEIASGKVEQLYTFSGADSKFDMTMLGQTISSTNHTAWSDMKNVDKTKGVYQLTMVMVILALVMLILLLVGGIMLMKGPEKKMLAVIFGVLAFVFALIGPVMFMAMLPGATNDDMKDASSGITNSTSDGPHKSFTGSTDSSLGKLSWGPGIGWIMGLMGFIFALLGFILVIMVKKPAAAPMGALPMQGAPMQPPMQQPPMEQYPMQQQPMYPPPQPPQYPPGQPPQYPPPQAPQYPPQYPPQQPPAYPPTP